jgi:methyltransferase
MAAARLVELAISRRNIQRDVGAIEGVWSRRTFPLMVALHAVVIVGTLLRGRHVRLPWLLLLIAVQPLRVWVLLSLGRHWNARGAVASEMTVVTSGPYAFVRHPNYAIVVIELLALPAAFGLRKLATVAALLNVLLLKVRIAEEESLLFRLPGYQLHFGKKPRFLPFVI